MNMGIRIENRSGVRIRICDWYEWDAATKTGYDGVKYYSIGAGGKLSISSSVFTKEIKNHMHPQAIKISVDGGEMRQLILSHDEFSNNDGCHLLLDMVENTLSYSFVSPSPSGGGGPNLFQKLRRIILPSRRA